MTEPTEFESCVYCPKLCRHACPVAVGSGREAATPTAMMTGPWAEARGFLEPAQALDLAALCTSCGACTASCKLARPVADLLRDARGRLGPRRNPSPLGSIEGEGAEVAVESGGPTWAAALSSRLGRPIATLRTTDDLGADLVDHPGVRAERLQALAALFGQRTAIVTTRGAARICRLAGVPVIWLADLVPRPDRALPLAGCGDDLPPAEGLLSAPGCCGGAAPLLLHHPIIAAELLQDLQGRTSGTRLWMRDSACAGRLRGAGAEVLDPVLLLTGPAPD